MLSAVGLVLALSTVWDGVYTREQADRGSTAYNTHCSMCHRADLGGGQGRALVGAKFFESWGEDTLDSLFAVIRQRMPENRPGSLDESTYLDILAYILQRNEYPAGATALTADAAKSILVVGRDGPAPVPNFALVRVVGCLEESAPGKWQLTRAGNPARTRDPAPSKGTERERSMAASPGTSTFDLMDAYDEPNGHAGARVEVKGLLMRGTPNRINFSSLQVLAPTCTP
ncbi:MAG: c-type cytochrome [Vicinamibacterales bacterium]